jgi:hypothetical protein
MNKGIQNEIINGSHIARLKQKVDITSVMFNSCIALLQFSALDILVIYIKKKKKFLCC